MSSSLDGAAEARLRGAGLPDRHLIHIDPAAPAAIGQPRPIMHGLCTLAATVLRIAELSGAHPPTSLTLDVRDGQEGAVFELAH